MLSRISVFRLITIVCILILLTACAPKDQPVVSIPDSPKPTAIPTVAQPTQSPIPEPSVEVPLEMPVSDDGNFIEHQVAYGTFDYVSGLTLFDIDNDGLLDIIGAAIKEKEVAWWRNNGENPIVWEKQVIGKVTQGALYVHSNDFDGDGDGDVISTGVFDEGTISLWINEGGSPIEWRMIVIADDLNEPHGVFIEDMDNDGDQDILANVAKANAIYLWENTGMVDGEISLIQHTISDDLTQNQSVMAIDLDADGLMDILASALGTSEILWWRNLDGSPPTWEKQIIGDQFIQAHWAEAGDVNGDGFLDVMGVAYNSDEVAVWYS
ncbi:MAG: VCBS repeat-containing protein, partial [Bacteroidales bacterium]|nr:VCBS repeat-containing protein [Bacteroidales bacterium]